MSDDLPMVDQAHLPAAARSAIATTVMRATRSLLLMAACSNATGGDASVTIVVPADGATVASPFEVRMKAEGLLLEPAGQVRVGAGHFHLMVDTSCVRVGDRIPRDQTHRHFDDGSRATQLSLPSGEHTLCLQAGDGKHVALDLTDEITITVVSAGGSSGTLSPKQGPQAWQGSYTGSVEWDCGPLGRRRGTLEGSVMIEIAADGTATMKGPHTVTGSCAGPEFGTLTTPIAVAGKRTVSGFEFPSTLWGVAGSFTITVTGNRGTGRFEGPAAGGSVIRLAFEIACTGC